MVFSDRFYGYEQPRSKGDAYRYAINSNSSFPAIILTCPQLDQNVGSVARTMLNFGLTELRIVKPDCNIYSDCARGLSCGAFELIEKAKVYPTLEAAVVDLTTVMATSDRPRFKTQMIVTPKEAARLAITGHIEKNEKVGIVFGREDVGLTNDEMIFCDTLITIPTISHFSSLNLAQAVNIICYELSLKNADVHDRAPPESWMETKRKEPLATRGDLEAYLSRLNAALDERNFHPDGSLRLSRAAALRNIYQRVSLKSI